jgi:myo-inositol 2-dehydrogenase/D-chiro-inositol 1-dehydrogenase
MSKTKVGFVGCGGIARYHADHLIQMDDVEIVAVYDTVEEQMDRLLAMTGSGRKYSSYLDMYDQEDLDAVYVCIPPYLHGDVEIQAAKRGINLFIEKPVATTMETVKTVNQSIEEAGIVSAVGFQDRYLDIISKAKEYIRGQEIGIVYGAWIGGIPGVPWWRRKDQSGGQIVEQSIHLLDMMRYFLGEAETVYSVGKSGIVKDMPGYDVEDYSSTIITFKNNVVATLFTGCYISPQAPNIGNGINFVCQDMRIEYELRKCVRFIKRYSTEEYQATKDGGMKADRTFIDAIKEKDSNKVLSPYKDAMKTMEIALAANQSIETGMPIRIG